MFDVVVNKALEDGFATKYYYHFSNHDNEQD